MTLAEFLKLPGAKVHDGGKQPVDDNVAVDVLYRSGKCDYWTNAWQHDWHLMNDDEDILAYRISQEAP